MMKTPVLETERLTLRPLTVSDANQVYDNWASDPEVAKFMTWEVHDNIGVTIEWLKSEEQNVDSDNLYNWGFILRKTGELIGSGGLCYKQEHDCYELGYNIMKKYWRQGLTTEAGRVILDFAVNTLGEKMFYCRHAIDNIGSMKVMTKLGFNYHGNDSYSSFTGKKHFISKEYFLNI